MTTAPSDSIVSAGPGRNAKSKLFALVTLVLSAALVALTIYLADPARVLAALAKLDLRWLVLAFLVNAVTLVVLGARWSLIAHELGVPLGFWRASREYAFSTALNQVLPGGLVGDGLRVLRQRKLSTEHSTLRVVEAVALDRIAGQLGLGAAVTLSLPLALRAGLFRRFSPFGSALSPGAALAVVALLALAGLSAAAFFLAYRFRKRGWFGLLERTQRILFSPRAVARHLPLSLALVACLLLELYIAARALGLTLPAEQLLGLGPLILLAGTLPSSFGGLGIREAASGLLFAGSGTPASTGVAVCVVFGLFSLVSSLPGLALPLFDGATK